MNENKYRVAVVIYEAGNEHLVFTEHPEAIVNYSTTCFVPADIEAAAAEATRQFARELTVPAENDYAPSED